MRNEGLMLRKGQGTEKDPGAAQDMLLRAAEAGLPTAQYDLAEMLLNGEAGEPDPKAALPWLTQAARRIIRSPSTGWALLYEAGQRWSRKDLSFARRL